MAKKKDNDRVIVEETYIVYAEVLAEATLHLTQAWNTFREFNEDSSRELTEREAVHLRSALYMVKEVFETLSEIAVKYNTANRKDKNIVPFRTGAIDVHPKEHKEI